MKLSSAALILAVLAASRSARAEYDDDRASFRDAGSNTTESRCKELGYYQGSGNNNNNYDSYNNWGYGSGLGNDLGQVCKSASSNPHGSFTSLGACTFKFHKIPEDSVPDNYLSTACADGNAVEVAGHDAAVDPVEQEVRAWPDACVGDFARCYRVDQDEQYLLPHLCTSRPALAIPDGTTHISVDCTADKARQKEKMDRTDEVSEFEEEQQKFMVKLYIFVFVYLFAAFLCCFATLCLVNRYAIKPYLSVVEKCQYGNCEMSALTRRRSRSSCDDPERAGAVLGLD